MKNMFIMMVGLPGSGKSSIADEIAHALGRVRCSIYSSDSIRKELTGSEECQDKDNEVFQLLHSRIKEDLSCESFKDRVVIYDACNISYKRRMAFLNEIRKIDCYKVCHMVWTSYEKCVQNNIRRHEEGGRFVPEWVIERMYKNIYIPQYYEGWDKIVIDTHNGCIMPVSLSELFHGENGLCKIPHDNPHHTYSIGDHCIACYLNTMDFGKDVDMNISMAGLLHDIGKPFTKDFKDSKGNPCETAHYYQHHLVSAYNAVPYLQDYSFEDMMEILALIQWHMFPYFWEKDNNEKMKRKYKKLWGDNLFDKIMLLHTADKNAH